MDTKISTVEELREQFEKYGIAWPWDDTHFEYRPTGYTATDYRSVASHPPGGFAFTSKDELWNGDVNISRVWDEFFKCAQSEREQYLRDLVATGKTREVRDHEEYQDRIRRWNEVANRFFPAGGYMSKAQQLWVDLYLAAPQVAEKITDEQLGKWMNGFWNYTPVVKDILEDLERFGLPKDLAQPLVDQPQPEDPTARRERISQSKFGKQVQDLSKAERLWVEFWELEPNKADRISVKAIQKWMVGFGNRPLSGIDVQKAVQARKIQ